MIKTKKIFNWILTGISLSYLLVVLSPSFIFENNLEYKNFSVYYHSNDINLEELKLVLNKSERILKSSELFKTVINQDIFICNSYNEFTFFALMGRKAFGVYNTISQNIFLSKSSISGNYVLRDAKENNNLKIIRTTLLTTNPTQIHSQLSHLQTSVHTPWPQMSFCD